MINLCVGILKALRDPTPYQSSTILGFAQELFRGKVKGLREEN